MATWEDLDSESESDKDDADEDAKVAVGLVATVTSEVELESDSEEENEVYSKILKTNELKDLKEKYVDSMKQQESALLDLKASREGLRGFDFICKTYEEKIKF